MRRDILNYNRKVSYRKLPGFIAWQMHRITGFILGLYFIMHIFANAGYMEWFNEFFSNKPVRVFLLIIILFHSFNGVRIILMDFADGAEKGVFMKQLKVVSVLTVIFFIAGLFFIF